MLKSLTPLSLTSMDEEKEYCSFAIENMTSSTKILNKIGLDGGGISPLINLFKLDSYHCKFVALMSLRKLGSRNKWKVVK